ncbi:hypothetical protein [Dactylosporangium vinaceum]|uniref:Uncharacterized protein n=1 Tax=Dactylosporangium vinaceum TaxID=53362 RepID=A0ABV5M3L8_9ACTN
MRQFRPAATDTARVMGEGPEVRGPIAAIMLVTALAAHPQPA